VVAYERRQALLARYISGQILGIVFGQAAGGFFGELIGWRATLLMLGVLHIGAGLLLLKERRRLSIGVTLPGKPRWANAAFETCRVLRQPWVRVVLISVFIEGMAAARRRLRHLGMPWLWLAVPAIACIGLGFYMLHNTL
jgi:predicted MFS family arabinose efflux permease